MILVAGGTGRLGADVVARLVADGHDVRVMTRDPARAAHLPDGVEIVEGDVRSQPSVERAVQGANIVVSAVQGFAGPGKVTPESVDREGNANLVDAAAGAGADVVLMSVVGAAAGSGMELFRAKYAAEQHLRASGTPWTIVRATAFIELWAEIMAKPIVFGRGDNPINFVSVHDVGAIVERAVVDPSTRGRVLEVGGPQNLTFNDLAALLQEVRGRERKIHHIPRAMLRAIGVFARQPRAALVMDTADMTFAAPVGTEPAPTDLRTALLRLDSEPDRRT
jgi:uncharacterized protein YbjT (DUF2867 family)